ncbi:MAG TPA: dolichyl-phosphate beta-glucosyltransferase [Candidatus Binatia bacterium]|jgi:dolichyl-phosphate beta-glucosyltransferase|nr:dolichyl-phosphate beta-glucosyltransferase [Candidatus Binatia bacterium]
MPEPALTVVIPAHNEAARIAEPLRAIDAHLRRHQPDSDIVVIDDGSTDATLAVVTDIAATLATPLTLLGSRPNRGKGFAVRAGMLHARGARVLMTDADLSTPIEELAKLDAAIDRGAAVAIGSRKMPGAEVEVHQPWLRESMGKIFTLLVRGLVVDVSDVTCGFKLFTRPAAHAIFGRVTLDDWSFDAEALYLARRLGFPLVEVPVLWRDVEGTKVRRGRDALRSAVGIARIVRNRLAGRYGTGSALTAPLAGVTTVTGPRLRDG